MADFEIEVPIRVTGDTGKSRVGENIAEQIKKSLGSIGIGKTATAGAGAGAGMVAGLTKLAGPIAIIAAVLEGLDFIIKPIMSLLKVALMLLLLPLVPILIPVLKGLAMFIEWFGPIAKKGFDAMTKFIGMIGQGAKWVWENVLKDRWEKIKENFSNIADGLKMLWSDIIKPALEFLGDLGIRVWDVIKGLFVSQIDAIVNVWEFIKGLFKGEIDVKTSIFDWFKGLFVGTIDVRTSLLSWFKGLFGGYSVKRSGPSTLETLSRGLGDLLTGKSVGDAIITPQGVVNTDPNDYLIATKNPGSLGGKSITININNASVRQDSDIRKLADEVSRVLQRQISGRISQ